MFKENIIKYKQILIDKDNYNALEELGKNRRLVQRCYQVLD